MKILLDHCVPKPFKYELIGHDIRTAREMGWEALKNGQLITQAESSGFEVLVTVDQNLQYQINMKPQSISVCVLVAAGITIEHLRALVPKLKERLKNVEAGKLYEVSQ